MKPGKAAFTLVELLVAITIMAVLMSLLFCAGMKARAHIKKTKEKVRIEHYMKHLPYIDEKPFYVQDNIAYFTNYAFPGILFTVQYEGSERPSL